MDLYWFLGEGYTPGFFVNLVAAVVILLIGIVAAGILSKLVKRVLHELEVDKILKNQAGVRIPLEDVLSSIVKYLVYSVAVVMALTQLGLNTIVLYILLFVMLFMLFAFIVLAFKDFIPNFSAGFFIHQKGMIKKGDYIIVNGAEGRVVNVSLIETEIETNKKDRIFIPNSILTKNRVIKKRK